MLLCTPGQGNIALVHLYQKPHISSQVVQSVQMFFDSYSNILAMVDQIVYLFEIELNVRYCKYINKLHHKKIIVDVLCFRPPVRAVCQNHEVVVFQPQTGTALDLVSVANYKFYSNPPTPTVSTGFLDLFIYPIYTTALVRLIKKIS